jgi:hypothetical protein
MELSGIGVLSIRSIERRVDGMTSRHRHRRRNSRYDAPSFSGNRPASRRHYRYNNIIGTH